MIKLEIDSVNYDIDDDLRSRIVDRIGSLDEFMSDLEGGRLAGPGATDGRNCRAEIAR